MRSALSLLALVGIDFRKALTWLFGLPAFCRDLITFRRQIKISSIKIPIKGLIPCCGDRLATSGVAKGHYFHQDLLVAQTICSRNPEIHFDVGSRIDGFVTHVASYRAVSVVDIRHLSSNVSNITFLQADIMLDLPHALVNCCDSLSCLNALEHFGLGRYGDTVACDGHETGLMNLRRMLRTNGTLYLSVPIGPQRVVFNAHRVFALKYLLDLFEKRFVVESFSYVDDAGDLHENEMLTEGGIASNYSCSFGCAIFQLRKEN